MENLYFDNCYSVNNLDSLYGDGVLKSYGHSGQEKNSSFCHKICEEKLGNWVLERVIRMKGFGYKKKLC